MLLNATIPIAKGDRREELETVFFGDDVPKRYRVKPRGTDTCDTLGELEGLYGVNGGAICFVKNGTMHAVPYSGTFVHLVEDRLQREGYKRGLFVPFYRNTDRFTDTDKQAKWEKLQSLVGDMDLVCDTLERAKKLVKEANPSNPYVAVPAIMMLYTASEAFDEYRNGLNPSDPAEAAVRELLAAKDVNSVQ